MLWRRKMHPARRKYLGLSLLSGAAAAALCWQVLRGAAGAPDGGDYATVLVFARPVEALAPMNSADVAWARWPESAITGGMVRGNSGASLPSLDNLAAPLSFSRGDPVPRAVIEAGAERVRIRPGMRAVSVRLADDRAASLLQPGALADVIFARGADGASNSSATLRGVRVLSVSTAPGRGERRRGGGASVLLELNPAQAEIAARAALSGEAAFAIGGQTEGSAAVLPPAAPILLVKNGNAVKSEASGPLDKAGLW
jgi:Flp pilus assembly protein CpaB